MRYKNYNPGSHKLPITIKKVSTTEELNACKLIRYIVFVQGQNVPLHLEEDGEDDTSDHILLHFDDVPAATARIRYLGSIAKIERVAVLDGFQGKGLGKEIMRFIIEELKKNPTVAKAKLSSQVHAIPFYEKLHFSVTGPEYLDAGIPHKDMVLFIKSEIN